MNKLITSLNQFRASLLGKLLFTFFFTFSLNSIAFSFLKLEWSSQAGLILFIFCIIQSFIFSYFVSYLFKDNFSKIQNYFSKLNLKNIKSQNFESKSKFKEWHSLEKQINQFCDRIHEDFEREKDWIIKEQKAQKEKEMNLLGSGISHEFNNIFQGIFHAFEKMKKENLSPQERSNTIEVAHSYIVRGKHNVNKILTFGNSIEEIFEDFDLIQVLKDNLLIIKKTMNPDVEIELKNYLGDSCIIHGSADQIGQIILNICNNAIQAVKEKNAKLEIELLNDRDQRIIMSFSDNGPGIEKEILKKVYDPFYSTKKKGSGTGLGLSVVKRVIEMHEGNLQIYSKKDMGTKVIISLPYSLDLQPKKAEGLDLKQQDKLSEKASLLNIVVVDDEPEIAIMCEEVLKEKGHMTKSFYDSIEASQYIQNHSSDIDLLVTDLSMPKLSGKDLVESVAKWNPSIKIIIASGYLEDFNVDDFPNPIELLGKPYRIKDLLHKVERLSQNNYARGIKCA